MKGLRAYIRKYGKHFTKELAEVVCDRWNVTQVENSLKDKVYYNVSDSTLGDIVFLSNKAYVDFPPSRFNNKDRCINYALSIVEDVNSNGTAFSIWLTDLIIKDKEFDFREYV